MNRYCNIEIRFGNRNEKIQRSKNPVIFKKLANSSCDALIKSAFAFGICLRNEYTVCVMCITHERIYEHQINFTMKPNSESKKKKSVDDEYALEH